MRSATTSVPSTTASIPFSDQAAKAFGSSRFSRTPATTMTEFSESARSAFHSKRCEQDFPASSVFPKAFGSGGGHSGGGHSGGGCRSSHSGGIPRSEFSDAAAAAFGGGRRHDYSDQAFSAFGGNGGSRGDSHPAFGKKERRPLVASTPRPVPLTPAELLLAEAKGKTPWSNSAIASTPTTIADVLKSDELFPALGSSGKGASTKSSVSADPAKKAPTMADMAKVWSSQHEIKRQAEHTLREREALRKAVDERQLQILKSIHIDRSFHRKAPVATEDTAFEESDYIEEQEQEQEQEGEYEEEDYN